MLESLLSLFLILTPLVVGFFIPFPKAWLGIVEQILGKLVLVILFFIGLSLSLVPNLASQLDVIVINVAVLVVCCLGIGMVGLVWLDKHHPWQRPTQSATTTRTNIWGSMTQPIVVIIGFIVGKLLEASVLFEQLMVHIDTLIKGLLMGLILLVGLQLSHSGMTLREVLFNKRGVQVSFFFCLWVAIGGIVFGLVMPNVTVMQGLALSSGYGWYSLSGIVMTDKYGAIWGSVALLNDLIREFLALALIPMLMKNYPSTAIGLGGVTTMDFTLPVIQASGGNEVIPLAMSFGFIVNILSPVLMVVFSSFG